jgi:hypothetical protein
VPADQPEVRQGTAQANAKVRIATQCPVDGGAEIVVISFGPAQPHRLLGTAKQRFRLFGEPEKVFRVPTPNPLRRSGFPQALSGVAAKRLEHPETGGATASGNDQGLVHQVGEQFQHVPVPAHLLGRFQREAPGEDSQPPEELSLWCRRKLIAPVDSRLERLLARSTNSRTASDRAATSGDAS